MSCKTTQRWSSAPRVWALGSEVWDCPTCSLFSPLIRMSPVHGWTGTPAGTSTAPRSSARALSAPGSGGMFAASRKPTKITLCASLPSEDKLRSVLIPWRNHNPPSPSRPEPPGRAAGCRGAVSGAAAAGGRVSLLSLLQPVVKHRRPQPQRLPSPSTAGAAAAAAPRAVPGRAAPLRRRGRLRAAAGRQRRGVLVPAALPPLPAPRVRPPGP